MIFLKKKIKFLKKNSFYLFHLFFYAITAAP